MTAAELNRRAFGAEERVSADISDRLYEEDELYRKWEAEEEAKNRAYLEEHPEEDDIPEIPFC